MADDLSRAELQELKTHFQRFDADNNGYIDFVEFREVIRSLGEDPPRSVVEFDFSVIDKDENGVVNFLEFSNWWLGR